MRPRALFLGIDVGTSGIRVAAIDNKERLYALLERPWPPGLAMDPATWRRLALRLLGGIIEKTRGVPIKAIAVDATSGTVLLCSELSGRPLTPAIAYNDARATKEAEEIQNLRLPAGPASGAHGGIAKWLWLERHYPIASIARIVTQGSWLTGVLLGYFHYSDEHNALKLGYDGQWHPALDVLGLRAIRPEIRTPGTPLGRLAPSFTQRFRLPEAPLIVAGTTDSIASLLALGPLKPGTGVTSLGSTLVLKIVSPRPICAPEFGIYSHKLGSVWLAGGASNSGGAVLAHYFGKPTLDALSAQINPAYPTQLHYYPLTRPGERFPINDPQLAPRLTPRPADDTLFLQGLLEGLAEIEARGYALLAAHGAPAIKTVITTGGGARNNVWRAIREEALSVPTVRLTARPAALGAARLARQGCEH